MTELSQIHSRLDEHGERITRVEERQQADRERQDQIVDLFNNRTQQMVDEIRGLRSDNRELNNVSQRRAGAIKFAAWTFSALIALGGLSFTAYKVFGG